MALFDLLFNQFIHALSFTQCMEELTFREIKFLLPHLRNKDHKDLKVPPNWKKTPESGQYYSMKADGSDLAFQIIRFLLGDVPLHE